MTRYILNRLIVSLVTIWILATVSFFMLRTLPGNPFQTEMLISAELQAQLMRYYGLDQPPLKQYLSYIGNLLQGDLGYSIKYTNRTVNSMIANAFPVSASLGLRSLAVAIPVGLTFGIASARRRGHALDYMLVVIAVIGMSVPSFVLGTALQYLFGVKWSLLPVAQWRSFKHTIMPTIAMSMVMVASLTRGMRASMLEIVSQDYVKTAKAKGLSERQIVWRHQVRNALLPIVTGMGPLIAFTLMGSFVIEQIFAIPGLGRQFVMSVQALDYTMALGLTVFLGSVLVLLNFIVDIAYVLIDPRIDITK